jgi:HAMP domain-containing protein
MCYSLESDRILSVPGLLPAALQLGAEIVRILRMRKRELDLPPLEVKGKDEIAEVTASFNRMHTSLIKAFEMLNG